MLKSAILLDQGISKEDIVIYKLLVRNRRDIKKTKASDIAINKFNLQQPPQPFCHKVEEKGGKGITLMDSSGRGECGRGRNIDKDIEKG